MSLKGAIGWSVTIHVGLMMVRPPAGLVPSRQVLHPLEVIHLPGLTGARPSPLVDSLLGEAAARRPAPAWADRWRPQGIAADAPVQRRSDQSKPESAPDRFRGSSSPAVEKVALPVAEAPVSQAVSTAVAQGPVAGVTGLPEEVFVSFRHKRQVREHLKARLPYPSIRMRGDVRLRLRLDSLGSLKEVVVLEESDSRVGGTAVQGIRSAQPYPPFPQGIRSSEVEYEFLVQYRYE